MTQYPHAIPVRVVTEEPPGSPEFKVASLHTCHALKTPPDLPSLTKTTLPCWLQLTLQPGHPDPKSTFGAVPDLRELRPPLWLIWFSVYASSLSSGSSICLLSAILGLATLDMGGWSGLTQQGLSPCKKRLASLGAHHGRNAGCPAPPAQIPACSIPAPGSSVALASHCVTHDSAPSGRSLPWSEASVS